MANRTWTAGPSDAGLRLDKFLADPARLGSRARAAAALQRGKIFVNDRETTTADAGARLARGDTVRVWMDRPGSAKRQTSLGDDRDLPIVYEDEALIVLNKPAGLLAVPLERRGDARSVFEDLKEYLRKRRRPRPLVVHRIDRDTSGLVLFAKNALVHARLKTQFARHLPERIYLAVVYGQPQPSSGTWRDHLVWDQKALIQKETHPRDPRAKQAISRYRVVETLKDASLVEVTLVTGRRNQIRLQARLRGHMLVGEQRYVYGPDSLRTITFPRQALHAARLALDHPITGRRVSFEAPLPDDLVTLIAKLRRS
ncbi:MAG: RluA family pseudouridine synthase [Acidobacteria bacterium]|nr:MAG: RluA family pseudouridine synthase [Acidobacteriota bacterium]